MADFGPDLMDFGATLVASGRSLPEFDRFRTKFGRVRDKFDRLRYSPDSGPNWAFRVEIVPNLGTWPDSTEVHKFRRHFDQIDSASDTCGRSRQDLDRCGARFGLLGEIPDSLAKDRLWITRHTQEQLRLVRTSWSKITPKEASGAAAKVDQTLADVLVTKLIDVD